MEGSGSDLWASRSLCSEVGALGQAAEACRGLPFPSLAPGKAGRKKGPSSRRPMWGWPDREAPGLAAIGRRPGSRKEGRATLAEAEIRRESCSAQWAPTRPGGPKSGCAPTWPPACSCSLCKYLPLFIFLLRCAPQKFFPATRRSVCPRLWPPLSPGSWAHPIRAMDIALPHATYMDNPLGQDCPLIPALGYWRTYGARSWVRPFCR